jgi:hypothetical protein
MLAWLDAWERLLPPAALSHVLLALVLPRLGAAVEKWDPRQVGLRGRGGCRGEGEGCRGWALQWVRALQSPAVGIRCACPQARPRISQHSPHPSPTTHPPTHPPTFNPPSRRRPSPSMPGCTPGCPIWGRSWRPSTPQSATASPRRCPRGTPPTAARARCSRRGGACLTRRTGTRCWPAASRPSWRSRCRCGSGGRGNAAAGAGPGVGLEERRRLQLQQQARCASGGAQRPGALCPPAHSHPHPTQELVINPAAQDLEPFHWVVAWDGLLAGPQLAALLEQVGGPGGARGAQAAGWGSSAAAAAASASWLPGGANRLANNTPPPPHPPAPPTPQPPTPSRASSPSGSPCCATGWGRPPTTTRSRGGTSRGRGCSRRTC